MIEYLLLKIFADVAELADLSPSAAGGRNNEDENAPRSKPRVSGTASRKRVRGWQFSRDNLT